MSFRNFDAMQDYYDEAYKLLREKFKFSSHEARKILTDVFWHIGEQPHVEELKNPKRYFLHAVRGRAARLRREEKKAHQESR